MRQDRRRYRKILLTVLLCGMLGISGCNGSSEATSREGTEKKQEVQDSLEVHFLDVGQGDSTLIKAGDHAMLIDAGENNQGEEVTAYLESQGVEKLDYLIGTHPDSDHIGGMDVTINAFDSDKIFMPEVEKDTKTYKDVIASAEKKSEEIVAPEVGDTYPLGEATFTIVCPNGEDYSSANDFSIGILLEHGENRFLFVGDAEEESEEEMLDQEMDLKADVYKVSHHGSRTATSEAFLQEISPEYAVISCGEGNTYGHPHAEVLNELRAEHVKVFRTDEQGTIVATSDGQNITWNMSSSEEWVPGEPTGSAASGSHKDQEKLQTYVLNTNTKKYHLPACDSVSSIKEKNREDRKTTEKALQEEGYSPCKNCVRDSKR